MIFELRKQIESPPVSVEAFEAEIYGGVLEGGFDITIDGKVNSVRTDWTFGQQLFGGTINGKEVFAQVERAVQTYRIQHAGRRSDVSILTPRAAELFKHMPVKVAPDMSKFLLSPMPGLLVKLSAKAGDEIKAGEELAVVEAMKMENSLRAEDDVVIAKVMADEGGSLVVDQPILEFE